MIVDSYIDDLIKDIKNTKELFGPSFSVYVIYSSRLDDGKEKEYISSFVGADIPKRDEIKRTALFGEKNEKEYQRLVKKWQKGIDSLQGIKYQKMTILELLAKIKEQNNVS